MPLTQIRRIAVQVKAIETDDLIHEGRRAELRLRTARVKVGSNRLFQALDLYWLWPKSGDLWCKSRQLEKTI